MNNIIEINQPEAGIGVVHLIWGPCGIETFNSFLQSYIKNQGGLKHDLILVFNGFSSEKDTLEYKSLLKHMRYSFLFIKKPGLDIVSYYIAANAFQYDYYCFLNSYSVILDKDWLTKLYRHATLDHVGLVGATASYQSVYSDFVNIQRFSSAEAPLYRRVIRRSYFNKLRHLYYYHPFPNYHIRTNAFMVKSDIFKRIKHKKLRLRIDTSRYENGRISLTMQIFKMKLDALVVGKDGKAYKKEDWRDSNTFWYKNQENLLISDNQTNKYSKANNDEKMYLSRLAWGETPSNFYKQNETETIP